MASYVHQHSKELIIDQTLNIGTDTLKLMLLQSTYDANEDPDFDFVDNAGANDPIDHESDCTGYTPGFGNRNTIAGQATTIDDTDNEVEFDFNDVAFGALGNGNNDTLGGVGLIKEITNDTASPFIAYDDTGNVTTNGGTITYAVNTEGMINF